MAKKNIKKVIEDGLMLASITSIEDYSEKKHGQIINGDKGSGTTSGGYFVKCGLVNEHERLC